MSEWQGFEATLACAHALCPRESEASLYYDVACRKEGAAEEGKADARGVVRQAAQVDFGARCLHPPREIIVHALHVHRRQSDPRSSL